MTKYYCDNCGVEVRTPNSQGWNVSMRAGDWQSKDKTLCSECKDFVKLAWEEGKKGRK